MTFDPQAYAAIAATNPAAAAQYLAAFSAPAAAPVVTPSPTPQPQAQPQPNQGYSNPAAVAPAPQLARGTLEDFYSQPTGGSAPSVTSKFFNKRVMGSWLHLQVTRDVTNADVRQQTTPDGKPQTYRDGRPKFVLVVPVQVLASSDGTHVAEFSDGEGSVWVKGVMADELRRAMTAAGDPSGYPKGGAQIVMTSAGEKAARTPGFNSTKLYTMDYVGPVGIAAEQIANPTVAAATATSVPPATAATTIAPSLVTTPAPAPSISIPPVPAVAAEVPQANFTPPPGPEAGPDKNALLAKLHGQQG